MELSQAHALWWELTSLCPFTAIILSGLKPEHLAEKILRTQWNDVAMWEEIETWAAKSSPSLDQGYIKTRFAFN